MKSFETFREIGDWTISQMTQKSPSCFNSNVRVERYKVTIEKIEEPKEVICARIQTIWDECDNHHNWRSIEEKANKYGYELKGHAGSNRKKFWLKEQNETT